MPVQGDKMSIGPKFVSVEHIIAEMDEAATITSVSASIYPILTSSFPIFGGIVGALYTLARTLAGNIIRNRNISGFNVTTNYEYVEDYWTPDGACLDMWMLIGTTYTTVYN